MTIHRASDHPVSFLAGSSFNVSARAGVTTVLVCVAGMLYHIVNMLHLGLEMNHLEWELTQKSASSGVGSSLRVMQHDPLFNTLAVFYLV